jgi:hypothetical protein
VLLGRKAAGDRVDVPLPGAYGAEAWTGGRGGLLLGGGAPAGESPCWGNPDSAMWTPRISAVSLAVFV